mmetsp:Transcript_90799/g.293132  ORF Transcript_90799/g.293132 Transcript_90799/m.293132 type:complete len:270 (-) Transcript_90799:700-1509(-)
MWRWPLRRSTRAKRSSASTEVRSPSTKSQSLQTFANARLSKVPLWFAKAWNKLSTSGVVVRVVGGGDADGSGNGGPWRSSGLSDDAEAECRRARGGGVEGGAARMRRAGLPSKAVGAATSACASACAAAPPRSMARRRCCCRSACCIALRQLGPPRRAMLARSAGVSRSRRLAIAATPSSKWRSAMRRVPCGTSPVKMRSAWARARPAPKRPQSRHIVTKLHPSMPLRPSPTNATKASSAALLPGTGAGSSDITSTSALPPAQAAKGSE